MFRDKITKVGTIEEQGNFVLPGQIFYIFLSPKGQASENVAIIEGKPAYNLKGSSIPFVVGAWNPVLLKSIAPTAEHIQKYNIFWGTEDLG